MDSNNLHNIPLDQLSRCPIQLRTVQKESMKYMMLMDSIKDHGVLTPALVRPAGDNYEVVAGAHRYEISCDLKLPSLPCKVVDLTDAEIDSIQIIENSNNIPTSTVDNIRRLQKILHRSGMSVHELAWSVHMHVDWVRKLLSLNHLSQKGKILLDNGSLSCILGIEIAKLPVPKQDLLLSLHSEYPAKDYLELCRQTVREHRGRSREDRGREKSGIKPAFRQFRKVRDEYLNHTDKATVLTRRNASTASEGWDACLQWTLSMDPETVELKEKRIERVRALADKKLLQRDLEFDRRKTNEQ